MPATPVLLVITHFPDTTRARQLARMVVESRLAACVNCLPAVESTYTWQGKLEVAEEIPLFIKTTAERYAELEQAIRIAHPFDLPEIIALPLEGLPEYLDWVRNAVAKEVSC